MVDAAPQGEAENGGTRKWSGAREIYGVQYRRDNVNKNLSVLGARVGIRLGGLGLDEIVDQVWRFALTPLSATAREDSFRLKWRPGGPWE